MKNIEEAIEEILIDKFELKEPSKELMLVSRKFGRRDVKEDAIADFFVYLVMAEKTVFVSVVIEYSFSDGFDGNVCYNINQDTSFLDYYAPYDGEK